jgi:ribosomal protein S3AE
VPVSGVLHYQKVHHRQELELLAREEKLKIYGCSGGDATGAFSKMVLGKKESVSLRRRDRLGIEASKVVVGSRSTCVVVVRREMSNLGN